MRLDSQLSFVPIGGNLAITNAAVPSTNTVDLLGVGVGQSSPNIIGTVDTFGTDMGIGGIRPELNVTVGTAFTTSDSATLNVALQAAADNGSNEPDTWVTLGETGPITAANLTAGQIVARFPWLPAFPADLQPRFLRLLFTPASGTAFTAGTIASALVTTVRDDYAEKFAAKNYVVA